MSHAVVPNRFPRSALIAMGLLAVVGIATAAIGRLEGGTYIDRSGDVPVASRALQFHDQPDGSVRVTNADTGQEVYLIEPGTGSFIRHTIRGLVRARVANDMGDEIPFHLSHFDDGHLVLSDPATNTNIDLGAFGIDNARAFAKLLLTEAQAQ